MMWRLIRNRDKLPRTFLGAFARLRKATISFVMSVRLYVRPHGTTRLPLLLLLLLLLRLFLLLLLLLKRYNRYKVLVCSTTFFQLFLFCATFFQLLMFVLFIYSKTSSSQRVLGLPVGLLDTSFHLVIFCTILSLAMRSTWPNQFV